MSIVAQMFLRSLPLLALVAPAYPLPPSAPFTPELPPESSADTAPVTGVKVETYIKNPNQPIFERLVKMIGELRSRSDDLEDLEDHEKELYKNILDYVVNNRNNEEFHAPQEAEHVQHPMKYLRQNLPADVEDFFTDYQGFNTKSEGPLSEGDVVVHPGVFFNLRNVDSEGAETVRSSDNVITSAHDDEGEAERAVNVEEHDKDQDAAAEGVYFSLRRTYNV